MITRTLREARISLNDLVRRAQAGEQVVLLRGSRPVVTLTPVTSDDLELAPRLTDAQAVRFWEGIGRERKSGRLTSFSSGKALLASTGKKGAKGKGE